MEALPWRVTPAKFIKLSRKEPHARGSFRFYCALFADLTLFWLSPKRPSPFARRGTSQSDRVRLPSPLLLQGEGPEGELCHSYLVMPSAASTLPRFVMLSAAKHPCCGFLTGVRNDKKEVLGMTKKCSEDRATSPCFGFRQNIPLLLQGEGRQSEVLF